MKQEDFDNLSHFQQKSQCMHRPLMTRANKHSYIKTKYKMNSENNTGKQDKEYL